MIEPIKPRKLATEQYRLLLLTAKFRFITSSLLSEHLAISSQSINGSLRFLVRQGYLDRFYDPKYHLELKASRYCLSNKSISLLSNELHLSSNSRRRLRRSASLTSEYIDQILDVFSIYLSINKTYPAQFNIYSQLELADYRYFPPTKADLYLHRIKPSPLTGDYLLYLFNEPSFMIKKKLLRIIEHFEEGLWEEMTKSAYPELIIVLTSRSKRVTIKEYLQATLENLGIDELKVHYLTKDNLSEATLNFLVDN